MLNQALIKKGKLKESTNSIFTPEFTNLKIVPVLLGLNGKPDSEFYNKMDKIWFRAKPEAKVWYGSRQYFKLGNVKETMVQSDTWVVHCVCKDEKDKLSKEAVVSCFKLLSKMAIDEKASVHLSKFVLDELSSLEDFDLKTNIQELFLDKGILVCTYTK